MKPPLQFFLDVIASKAWSDVTVLTFAPPNFTNPTFTALRLLNGSGMLGPNVVLHNVRADIPRELVILYFCEWQLHFQRV